MINYIDCPDAPLDPPEEREEEQDDGDYAYDYQKDSELEDE